MRLTKKKALEISIELWEWLAETGEDYKRDWVGWDKYGEMRKRCPLCEYTGRKLRERDLGEGCAKHCPLSRGKKYGCEKSGGLYLEWCEATTESARKKCAQKLLEQLRSLK